MEEFGSMEEGKRELGAACDLRTTQSKRGEGKKMQSGLQELHLQSDGTEEQEEQDVEACWKARELIHSSILLPMLLRTVCELGIPELLHAAKEPLSAHQIAGSLRLQVQEDDEDTPQSPISADNLDRVLRCLATHGVFRIFSCETTSPPTPLYTSTQLSAWFLPVAHRHQVLMPAAKDARPTPSSAVAQASGFHQTHHSLRGMLMLLTSPAFVLPWLHLSPFLSHGPPRPFHRAHSLDLWPYALARPSFLSLFIAAMADDTVSLNRLLSRYHDFADMHSLVDVGGCDGAAAVHIASAFPSLKVTCFDLPHVISTVSNRFPGVEYVGGDMFQSIPEAGAILLKRVLHDWSDEDCIKILENCRKSLPRGGKLLIMDSVLEIYPDETNELSKFKMLKDILMLAFTNGGKERTKTDWEILLSKADFSIQNIIDLSSQESLIEAISMPKAITNQV